MESKQNEKIHSISLKIVILLEKESANVFEAEKACFKAMDLIKISPVKSVIENELGYAVGNGCVGTAKNACSLTSGLANTMQF
jgi:hypothetical protein